MSVSAAGGGVYIVSPLRSAVAKSYRGALAHTRSDEVLAQVIQQVLRQTQEHSVTFDPAHIEDVIVGCAMPEAEQGMNTARVIALLAGLPVTVPGMTINRFCSSGLQSIAIAADRVAAGHGECFVAGGVESMTMVPMMGNKPVGSAKISAEHPAVYMSMGLTAEKVAARYGVSRESQDEFAYHSHQKALQALADGHFSGEIATIKTQSKEMVKGKAGHTAVVHQEFATDEGPRADTSMEKLAKLRPVFLQGGTVTAGSSSQVSDGGAACLVCSESFVNRYNLKPMARLMSYCVAGVEPEVMGMGPVEALPKALAKAGIQTQDLDHVELNEAFAAQSLAVIEALKLDTAKVNPSGGAIALGHPLGATGAKLVATLLYGLKRKQQKYGAVTMCIGTGMGAAGIFELIE